MNQLSWLEQEECTPRVAGSSPAFIPMEEQTIGEKRVRTSFNPSQVDVVAQIKQKSAELINLCEELKAKDPRLASIAQTSYEEAAMWAVKAATA